MNYDYEKLENDMLLLVDGLKSVLTEDEISRVKEYASRYGEYGLAFEELCAILKDKGAVVPQESRPLFHSLIERMNGDGGIDDEWWSGLSEQKR